MTVTLTDPSSGKVVQLTADQVDQFQAELRQTLKRPFVVGHFPKVGPDCLITVRNKGKQTKYALYGRSVLLQIRTNRSRQFYFGLLLLEWLR
jgi:hypothetical protein